MSSIYDEALASLTKTWIEANFKTPGASWDGEFYQCADPLNPGSKTAFRIWASGKVWRGVTQADTVIELIAARDKISREAAAAFILGRDLKGLKSQRKAGKVKAVVPVPEDKLKDFEAVARGEHAKATHGEVSKVYTYRTPDNGLVFVMARFAKGSEVTQQPYFFGEDNAWHEGYAVESARPMYNLPVVAQAPREVPILLVADERAAKTEVPGYIAVTWSGGHKDFSKTDWSPLDGRPVTIWAGKSSTAAHRRFPEASVLMPEGKPDDWDVADAKASGIDLGAFMESCPRQGGPGGEKARPDDGMPFICLGYDTGAYYFMPRKTRVVHTIGVGSFRGSQILELAPLSWWGSQTMVGDAGAIKQGVAQDFLIGLQHQTGWFDPEAIRGAGVWSDATGAVLNDGRQIVTMDKRILSYDDFKSQYVYVPSKTGFGAMHGAQSTDDDGRLLQRLFEAQIFEERSQAVLLMGWCLIAPFGGALKWRPHVWIAGRKGSGKSHVMENLVALLCGPFAHLGTAKDSEAGLRRKLNSDARPVILDEMEPSGPTSEAKIKSILELARNSSSDASSGITMGGGLNGAAVTFKVRSCFAFSSINVPTEGAAIQSRVSRIELKAGIDMGEKARVSKSITEGGLLDDPGRFRRRIFHALPRIMADIEYIRSTYRPLFGDQRAVDQVAPLLAAAWAARSALSVRESGPWIEKWIAELAVEGKRVEEDEDAFFRILLGSTLKTDENKTRTVAELMRAAADPASTGESGLILERHGMGIKRATLAGPARLVIATNSAKIAELFRNTPYTQGYDAQLRRHKLAKGGNGDTVTLAGRRIRCQSLDWDAFRALYLDEDSDEGAPF